MLKGLSERAVKRMIDFALAPLKRKVRTMVMRAVVEMVGDDDMLQTVQVSRADDLLDDDVERFQQYGFSSVPYADAEAIILLLGGNADVPVAISVDDRRYRPTGNAEGEIVLYTKRHGIRFLLRDAAADKHVLIGTEPEEYAARADRVDARLDALETAHNDHTHQYTDTTPTGSVLSSTQATTTTANGESTACDEVKIK